ncbi:MAG: aldehyde dehydrogenase family protein [Acidimicrobiia bacterium]|nr:aldehyde dehydrogenase family protein [Acidimicrobiia bacterium]
MTAASSRSLEAYEPEAMRAWHLPGVVERFAHEVEVADAALRGLNVPVTIDGRPVATEDGIDSFDPADPTRIVARSGSASAAVIDEAVAVANRTHRLWSAVPPAGRAEVLFAAADALRADRDRIAAIEVFEAGKPWSEADGDLCEAIDFLEFYGRAIVELDASLVVQSPLGEANSAGYRARGVTAVISPWNFPLAIPMGMVSAAIAAGNAVVFKPAEQTPAIAYEIVKAFEAAGLPEGVLSFTPGRGEVAGARLVEHPDVATIEFTGSRAVGLAINQRAAASSHSSRYVKRVIAEMGGKNAIVVDSDADLDEAVPEVAKAAFGFAGQKCSACSRLIVVGRRYDEVIERLAAHADTFILGHPKDGATSVGPVIDADAHERLLSVIDGTRGTVRYRHQRLPETGWFVPPTIVDGLESEAPLRRDEQFGPLLAVVHANDLDHAFELANATDYALTAGLFSRSPDAIARAGELQAGNIYVNRGTTGAVVGRQPFGGMLQSGTGPKAGTLDTLRALSSAWVVTENTMRQGFAADLVT